MDWLSRAILGRVFDRLDSAAGFASSAGNRSIGGGLMGRIATVGILRLAMRWPALTLILVLSVVAARLVASRRQPPADPIVRAP